VAAGFGAAAAGFSPLKTEPPRWTRLERMDSDTAVTIKTAASTAVAFDKKVAVPRGPKAVWLPMPPKAPAMSVPRELWSSTKKIRTTATSI